MAIIMPCAELNVVPPPSLGGTLSSTSLIISAVLAFGPLRRTRRTRREVGPVILRTRVAKKRNGTLRTASLPVLELGFWLLETRCVERMPSPVR